MGVRNGGVVVVVGERWWCVAVSGGGPLTWLPLLP